jgi:CspA family cold shock protein
MQTRDRGVIIRFLESRGFGFIKRTGAPDLFFHVSAFREQRQVPLVPGMELEFEVESSPKGLRATDVVIP